MRIEHAEAAIVKARRHAMAMRNNKRGHSSQQQQQQQQQQQSQLFYYGPPTTQAKLERAGLMKAVVASEDELAHVKRWRWWWARWW